MSEIQLQKEEKHESIKEIAKKGTQNIRSSKEKSMICTKNCKSGVAERDFEDFYIHGFGVVSEPNGDNQSNGCYCDQVMLGEDYGSGNILYSYRRQFGISVCYLFILILL
ncbi:MAG: hypothetical protein ACLTX3_08535 [Lachnospiraceae bacterium]